MQEPQQLEEENKENAPVNAKVINPKDVITLEGMNGF